MNKLPSEGKIRLVDDIIIEYFNKKFGVTDSKMTKDRATGIAWNERGYWFINTFDLSRKPIQDSCEILAFCYKELGMYKNQEPELKVLL